MTGLRRIMAVFAAATLALAACVPSLTPEEVETKLKAATASVLQVDPSAITIIDPQATQTRRIWRAEADGRTFDCDADRSFAVPACTTTS